jgi:hypothetical protein
MPACGVAAHIVQGNAIMHTCEAGTYNDVIIFYWFMTPCSHVGGYKYFRGACCLKLLRVIRNIGIHLIKLV